MTVGTAAAAATAAVDANVWQPHHSAAAVVVAASTELLAPLLQAPLWPMVLLYAPAAAAAGVPHEHPRMPPLVCCNVTCRKAHACQSVAKLIQCGLFQSQG